jgi:hypothetical protein
LFIINLVIIYFKMIFRTIESRIIKTYRGSSSEKLKADISVADGESVLDCACILGLVCRGPWDPCLRLINWVVIN